VYCEPLGDPKWESQLNRKAKRKVLNTVRCPESAMNRPITLTHYTAPFLTSCLLVLTFGTAFGQIAGDFNGDGIPDLTTPGLMRLGNGDGTFRSVTFTIPTGSTPVSIVAGDFNRDGKLDLVSFRPG
jgi:hypothetical protein